MSISQETPIQLEFTRRRPGMTEFDSLQDLLEQAGYKETRIFTPIAVRMPSAPANKSMEVAPQQQASSSSPTESVAKIDRGTSNWFNTLWSSSSSSRNSTLNRKQSEPVLSKKKGRKAAQKSWMGAWGSSKDTEERVGMPPVPPLPGVFKPSSIEMPVTETEIGPLPPPPQHHPPLRHAPSTGDLWKGSLQHHKSFPAKLREQRHQGKAVTRKESFDGAGVVAGVGVGAAKADLLFKSREDQRVSLRQAFGRGENSSSRVDSIQHTYHDSVGSLVDLQERRWTDDKQVQEDDYRQSVAPIPAVSSLFSVAATPVLSRQDAVAMRNVDCLDFAGMQHDDHFGPPSSSKGLRKMRSVDALELALAKMEDQRQANGRAAFQKHATIPESFSTDSLTNEDLASANAVTTIVGDSVLQDNHSGNGQFDDPPSRSASFADELAIRRSSTPRLVITSPTGMRSPQPLVLEGREFEPRSISPRKPVMIRPVPNRTASLRGGRNRNALLQKPEEAVEVVTKRSISKRRSRVLKIAEGDRAASTATVSKTTKRASKSCNDLRGIPTRTSSTDSSQMSGSEQIRALQRNVLERHVAQEVVYHHHTGVLESKASNNIPSDQFDDEDDPFRDFATVASNKPTHSSRGGSAPPHIDRRMSPIPFDHLKRRPLSSSTGANIAVVAAPPPAARPLKMESTVLSQKKSGVGLACLVQPVPPRNSSFSDQGNENAAPNSLLDSPTAHVVKKRSSRTRLGQRS